MQGALLCPGPSLARTFDDDFAGVRVGVNRAPHAFSCDWWSALDHGPITREPFRLPLLTTLAAKQHLFAFDRPRLESLPRVVTCEDLYREFDPAPGWATYSATAGLILCAWLGATEIRVYGADWAADAPDWDGHQDTENRRAATRWAEESGFWNKAVKFLAGKGVTVERVLL